MGSPVMWLRYFAAKAKFALSQNLEVYKQGYISQKELVDGVARGLMRGRLTFRSVLKGDEMQPTLGGGKDGEMLLVRSLPEMTPRSVFVGDVVVFKDPRDPERKLVRRIAAMEGDEMVSSSEEDTPFHLPAGSCWVLCDNEQKTPKDGVDSRAFGPLPVRNIIGRAIYSSRSPVDHGQVVNSEEAMEQDSPILAVELNIGEMTNSES